MATPPYDAAAEKEVARGLAGDFDTAEESPALSFGEEPEEEVAVEPPAEVARGASESGDTASPVVRWLETRVSKWTPSSAELVQVMQALREWTVETGVDTVQDLRSYFTDVTAAMSVSAAVGAAWVASLEAPVVHEAKLAETKSQMLPLMLKPMPPPTPARPKLEARPKYAVAKARRAAPAQPRRPRVNKPAVTESADKDARYQAAYTLTQLAIRWRPHYGLFRTGAATITEDRLKARMRMAAQRLIRFEKRTLDSARNAWLKWEAYIGDSGTTVLSPDVVEDPMLVVEFIDHTVGSAPTAARALWNNIQFCVSHLSAPIKLDAANRPERGPGAAGAVDAPEPATVAEPAMVAHLESIVADMHEMGDWRWPVIAAAIIMARGCLRYAHLQRARPWAAYDHGHSYRVFRGKSSKAAFHFYVPIDPRVPKDPSSLLWILWNQHAEAHAGGPAVAPAGLVVDPHSGAPISLKSANAVLQNVLKHLVAEGEVSTYSFRRYGPTLCDLVGRPWEFRMAFGGWREDPASEGRAARDSTKKSNMPARYSGRKLASEMEAKFAQFILHNTLLNCVAQQELGVATWEAFAASLDSIGGVDGTTAQVIQTIDAQVRKQVATLTSVVAGTGVEAQVARERLKRKFVLRDLAQKDLVAAHGKDAPQAKRRRRECIVLPRVVLPLQPRTPPHIGAVAAAPRPPPPARSGGGRSRSEPPAVPVARAPPARARSQPPVPAPAAGVTAKVPAVAKGPAAAGGSKRSKGPEEVGPPAPPAKKAPKKAEVAASGAVKAVAAPVTPERAPATPLPAVTTKSGLKAAGRTPAPPKSRPAAAAAASSGEGAPAGPAVEPSSAPRGKGRGAPEVCHRFLRGKCTFGDSCRYIHPSGERDGPPLDRSPCRAFLRGDCFKGKSCHRPHVDPATGNRVSGGARFCRQWAKAGKCDFGRRCKYLHADRAVLSPSASLSAGAEPSAAAGREPADPEEEDQSWGPWRASPGGRPAQTYGSPPDIPAEVPEEKPKAAKPPAGRGSRAVRGSTPAPGSGPEHPGIGKPEVVQRTFYKHPSQMQWGASIAAPAALVHILLPGDPARPACKWKQKPERAAFKGAIARFQGPGGGRASGRKICESCISAASGEIQEAVQAANA